MSTDRALSWWMKYQVIVICSTKEPLIMGEMLSGTAYSNDYKFADVV